jgi:hypothetical protein
MLNPKLSDNQIQTFQRVKVYRNIRKQVFSVLDKKSRRLIAHKPSLVLTNVEFMIGKAGQKRVRLEKQKNVHAYVIGDYVGTIDTHDFSISDFMLVIYNPYLTDTFIIEEENIPIFNADKCYLINGKCYVNKNSNDY